MKTLNKPLSRNPPKSRVPDADSLEQYAQQHWHNPKQECNTMSKTLEKGQATVA